MTHEHNSRRDSAATWVAVGLAVAIPAAILLGFMRGLTSVWRTKWESDGQKDAADRYDLGPQSRVNMLTGTPVATGEAAPAAQAEAPRPATAVAEAESPAVPETASALSITSVSSPVERGATATVEARAAPNAACRIEYRLPGSGNVSNAQGLDAKTAAADGLVSWTWSIGPGTRPGAGSVTVVCGDETASATIEVT
jgi:hypothetical protein